MATLPQPFLFSWKEIDAAEAATISRFARCGTRSWPASSYELPLAFSVDVASSSDMTHLIPLVENVEENHKELHDDMDETAADKGYDSADNNAALYDDHGVKPVIDTPEMWKTKKFETLFPYRYDVFCYDESGRVYCSCPSEKRGKDELRELAFVGFEKE